MSAQTSSKAWSGRPVLVTGAGGFIGSHLVEALVRAGAEVRAFVRYNSRGDHGWLEVSTRRCATRSRSSAATSANPEAVASGARRTRRRLPPRRADPDPVLVRDTRASSSTDERRWHAERARGRAPRGPCARVVHTSTSEVYGTARTVPIDEEHPLQPQSPYAATKIGADQLALSFQRSFDLPVVVARPFNTYGRGSPRVRSSRRSSRRRWPATRSSSARPSPTRDFLYVEDTVARHDALRGGRRDRGRGLQPRYRHARSRSARWRRRCSAARQRSCRYVRRGSLRPADSEVERLVADGGRRSALGWEPEVDLDEGLQTTIDWIARLARRLQAVDLQRLTQRLDHRVDLLVGLAVRRAAT